VSPGKGTFVVDADVLIDYVETDPAILRRDLDLAAHRPEVLTPQQPWRDLRLAPH